VAVNVVNRENGGLWECVDPANYPVEDWIHDPDLTAVAGLDPKYWKITGDVVSAMTEAEKAAVDQPERYAEMAEAVTAYLYGHFDEQTQDSLELMYTKAVRTNQTNRADHIESAITWWEGVMNSFYSKKATIFAATTQAGVAAVTWDWAGDFDGTKPDVTIENSLAITD
jgi:hypothetical protein